MSQPVTGRFRNQRVSPRQIQFLEALWSAKLRRARKRLRPETSQAARLRHISEAVGREVSSPAALTWQEANRVIQRLLEEIGPPRGKLSASGEADARVAEELPEGRPE